ncbi:hypothetical protein, partial [Enterobacter intestinihominis]
KQNWERGHDNGEAEVAGGGFALTRLQKKLPQKVRPVKPPPTAVKAGPFVAVSYKKKTPQHNPVLIWYFVFCL